MYFFRKNKLNTVLTNWLTINPSIYALIPYKGIRNQRNIIRMDSPITWVIRHCSVLPFPFKMLFRAEERYNNGQIKLNLTMYSPAISL